MVMKRETHLRKFQDRFLVLRLLFVVAVAVLGACEVPQVVSVVGLLGFMLLIELYLKNLQPFSFCNDMVLAGVLVTDTAIVSGVLVLASVNTVSFILFFLVLIMVAYIENQIVLGILTTIFGGVALYMTVDDHLTWARVPFLTAAGQYYAYLITADKLLDPPPTVRYRRPGQMDVHVIDHGAAFPTPAGAPPPPLPAAAIPAGGSPWDTDEQAVRLPDSISPTAVVNELSRVPLRSR